MICRKSDGTRFRLESGGILKFLVNLRVITQLVLVFGILLSMLVGIGFLGLSAIYRENDHVESLRENWIPGVAASQQMQIALKESRLRSSERCRAQLPMQRNRRTVASMKV